jgi:hypothetical protein
MQTLVIMYGLDLLILLLALGAALVANGERHGRLVPRNRLVLPGVLAILGAVVLLAYPEIRDLADLQAWSVGLTGVACGTLRGWFMNLQVDQAFGVTRLHRAGDGIVVGGLMTVCAAVQGGIETGLHAENPYETTAELMMLLAGGFMLGRSVILWLRGRTSPHVDLKEA